MIRASLSQFVLLVVIVVFGGLLRGFGVSLVGYWTDELCSLSCADGWGLELYKVPLNGIVPTRPVYTRLRDAAPIRAVPAALARDETHPPVYVLLLRMWETVFGDNEAGTRSLNIAFSLIAIVLMYVAARETVGASAGLWAALLMAVASPQITFSLEARDYMPAMMFCLAACIAMTRLGKKPTLATGGFFGLMLLLAMMTHYYSAGVASALVLHAIVWMRGRSRWLVLGGAVAAALLFVLIWGQYFLWELPNFQTNTGWLYDNGPGALGRWASRLCRVPGMLVAADLPGGSACLALLFLFLPMAYVRRPELRLWILWLICTVGLIAGQDLLNSTKQLTLPRYLLFATPAGYVILSAAMRGRFRWLPPAAGVIIALLSLRSAYAPAWKIDLRTPTDFVRTGMRAGDGLVISGPDAVFDGITYAAFQHYLPAMPKTSAVLTEPANAATLDHLRECPHVWLLWMWPGRPVGQVLPGFVADDDGHLPYFGELLHGRLRSVTTSANTEGKH